MAKITKTKKAPALNFEITKTALAVVEIKNAMIEKHGEHALLVTYKKPRSSKYRKMIVHRQNLISSAGGEMDFDGTIMYRGIQEVYNSRGTVESVDANTITFVDQDGVRHMVPASTDQNIVLTIVSDDMDRSEVKTRKKKGDAGEKPKASKKGAAADKAEASESASGKKKTKKVSKFPTRKAKKA